MFSHADLANSPPLHPRHKRQRPFVRASSNRASSAMRPDRAAPCRPTMRNAAVRRQQPRRVNVDRVEDFGAIERFLPTDRPPHFRLLKEALLFPRSAEGCLRGRHLGERRRAVVRPRAVDGTPRACLPAQCEIPAPGLQGRCPQQIDLKVADATTAGIANAQEAFDSRRPAYGLLFDTLRRTARQPLALYAAEHIL